MVAFDFPDRCEDCPVDGVAPGRGLVGGEAIGWDVCDGEGAWRVGGLGRGRLVGDSGDRCGDEQGRDGGGRQRDAGEGVWHVRGYPAGLVSVTVHCLRRRVRVSATA